MGKVPPITTLVHVKRLMLPTAAVCYYIADLHDVWLVSKSADFASFSCLVLSESQFLCLILVLSRPTDLRVDNHCRPWSRVWEPECVSCSNIESRCNSHCRICCIAANNRCTCRSLRAVQIHNAPAPMACSSCSNLFSAIACETRHQQGDVVGKAE